jgi:hypothetical protein
MVEGEDGGARAEGGTTAGRGKVHDVELGAARMQVVARLGAALVLGARWASGARRAGGGRWASAVVGRWGGCRWATGATLLGR